MAETPKITEQIFSSIDRIGELLESTVDLKDDVFPFVSATLAKIKELAIHEKEFDVQYELFQIATNYLPKALDSYCGLPVEYRNKKIIKNDKTARNLLVEDLKIFKKEIIEIEHKVFSKTTNQMQINSRVINDKYSSKFQLAHEVEEMPDNGFVEQFDYEKYIQIPSYKSVSFKREETDKKPNERLIKFTNQCLLVGSYLKNKAIRFVSNLKDDIQINFKKIKNYVANIQGNILVGLFFSLLMIFFCCCFVIALISSKKDSNYEYTMTEKTKSIYNVMAASIVPKNEFENFVLSSVKDIQDYSSLARKRMSYVISPQKDEFSLKFTQLEKGDCYDMVDIKENSLDGATVYINSIPLPKDVVVSNAGAFLNDNHNLCHLKENNTVTINFNNEKIFEFAQKTLSSKELENKKLIYQKELEDLQLRLKNMSELRHEYTLTTNLIKQLTKKIEDLK